MYLNTHINQVILVVKKMYVKMYNVVHVVITKSKRSAYFFSVNMLNFIFLNMIYLIHILVEKDKFYNKGKYMDRYFIHEYSVFAELITLFLLVKYLEVIKVIFDNYKYFKNYLF